MAGSLINTLYPPLVDTFMPAFVNIADSVRIYFSLSPYNNPEKIEKIHFSLVDQKTNQNVFQEIDYADDVGFGIVQGILIINVGKKIKNTNYDSSAGLYFIDIKREWLIQETKDVSTDTNTTSQTALWKTELWYQGQIRLDCCSNSPTKDGFSNYILNERQYFSEWSSVVLLRAIPQPALLFSGIDSLFDKDNNIATVKTQSDYSGYYDQEANGIKPSYNQGWVPIAAEVKWGSTASEVESNTEYLTNYRITIFNTRDLETPFIDSGVIHVGNGKKDSIYYLADMNKAEVNRDYLVRVNAVTRNEFKWSDEKLISIGTFAPKPFDVNWNFTRVKLNSLGDEAEKIVTEEDGFVQCTIVSKYDMDPGFLYVYRESSLDNYQKQEILQVTAENGKFVTTFTDYTPCSLVQYRYRVQYHFLAGTWSQPVASEYVYPDFYDILIMRQGRQLAIRYDGKISSVKPVVNRVKIDTLGSKYPKFAENARMNYRQFQISGYISSESDFNRKFLVDDIILTHENYDATLAAYNQNIGNEYLYRNDTVLESTDEPFVEGQHDSTLLDNWYWERRFREEAIAWLNDGEPKLFRSMTEGNMIVMLTDISMTPNETLGRRLYTFSATAYEIGEGLSIKECDKYGVIDVENAEEDRLKRINDGTSSQDEEDENQYISIREIGQYIYPGDVNFSKDANGADFIGGDTNVLPLYYPISIREILNAKYSGIFRNRTLVSNSIYLTDIKIQFISKPYWMDSNLNIYAMNNKNELVDDDGNVLSSDQISQSLLGYKLELAYKDNSTTGSSSTIIFVGPKGYYQIPSDMQITAIRLYNNDAFELNYFLNYKLGTAAKSTPSKIEKLRDVVGQYTNTFYPDEALGDKIREKYHKIRYVTGTTDNDGIPIVESEQLMQRWYGLGVDVTPYASLYIQPYGTSDWEHRLVGETGVYNLMSEFDIGDIKFEGRRMVQAPADNRPFLDEWEYVLDPSCFNQPSGSANPFYWYKLVSNTVPPTSIQTNTLVYIGFVSGLNDIQTVDLQSLNETEWNIIGEEKEYVYIDLQNIKNPQYNTVYKITDEYGKNAFYVIYYLDQSFYRINFDGEDLTEGIARVPIYGQLNYRGTVMQQFFSTLT